MSLALSIFCTTTYIIAVKRLSAPSYSYSSSSVISQICAGRFPVVSFSDDIVAVVDATTFWRVPKTI